MSFFSQSQQPYQDWRTLRINDPDSDRVNLSIQKTVTVPVEVFYIMSQKHYDMLSDADSVASSQIQRLINDFNMEGDTLDQYIKDKDRGGDRNVEGVVGAIGRIRFTLNKTRFVPTDTSGWSPTRHSNPSQVIRATALTSGDLNMASVAVFVTDHMLRTNNMSYRSEDPLLCRALRDRPQVVMIDYQIFGNPNPIPKDDVEDSRALPFQKSGRTLTQAMAVALGLLHIPTGTDAGAERGGYMSDTPSKVFRDTTADEENPMLSVHCCDPDGGALMFHNHMDKRKSDDSSFYFTKGQMQFLHWYISESFSKQSLIEHKMYVNGIYDKYPSEYDDDWQSVHHRYCMVEDAEEPIPVSLVLVENNN